MTEYLTSAELCDLLHVHRTTIRALGIPYFHVGNRLRFQRSDVDAWVAARIVAAGGGDDGLRQRDVPSQGRRPLGGPGTGRTRQVPKRDRDGRARDTRPVAGAAEVGPEDLVFPAPRR